jgi:H+/Cl- antiporter ClcA
VRKKALVLLLAVALGAADALIFKGFEAAVNHGTHYIWDTLFNSGVVRWRVVPLAVVLGLAFSALFVLLKQPRMVPPKINSTEAEDSDERPTLMGLGVILAIGLMSLLAGASLGPEAALVALTGGGGLWLAYRTKLGDAAKLFELASVGALLVAFFGSYILVALPLLMLLKNKRLDVTNAAVVLVTGASAFGMLWLLDHHTVGYGTIPAATHFTPIDYFLAALLGAVTAVLGWLLKQFILRLYDQLRLLEGRFSWFVTGPSFGFVVGLLYLAGGQSVQFSGSTGSHLLLSHQPPYALWMLFVILIAKLLVTGWSLGSGYRGGLVFPSVFIGVTVAAIAENIAGLTGPGVMIGSTAGVFSAMLGPAPALIAILALVPLKLSGVAVVAIVFAAIVNKAISRFTPATPATPAAPTPVDAAAEQPT